MISRLLVVASDHVGTRMAGPGVRAWRFAEALAEHFDVTLAVPYATDLRSDAFDVVVENPHSSRAITALGRGFDVVVAQRLPVPTAHALARAGKHIVYDLYAPILIENLAFDSLDEPSRVRELHYRLNTLEFESALATGAAFVCASEKQRDFFLGSLIVAGRVDHSAYEHDSSLRNLIDVVPFGIDPLPPSRQQAVLRDVVPGIGEHDRILLWGGGIWNWFDPLTVIRAVEMLTRNRDDVRLFFLGTRHPNPRIAEMAMTQRALELAEELGLRDRNVFFNFGWVPYAERGAYLLEADVGVAAHFDGIESRFAFRTRLLDYVWAGLPIVTTRGDALSEVVEERGLGRAVEAGDATGYAEALDALLADGIRERLSSSFESVRRELEWPRVLEPLIRLSQGHQTTVSPRAVERLTRWALTRAEYAARSRGVAGAARRAVQIALQRRPTVR
jgi:glycosyltransferase involved in cell wall biosynthesis